MSGFAEALGSFRRQCDEVDAILDWMDERAHQILAERRFEQVNKIRAGCTVLLSGYLEEYLKEAVRCYCEELCKKSKPFFDLAPDLQRNFFRSAAKYLDRRTSGEGWKEADAVRRAIEAGKRIAALEASPSYDLFWEELAETRGNPGPDVIRDLLKGLGLKDPWKSIDSSGALQAKLKIFVEQRNRCAHSGSGGNPPEADVLRDIIGQLKRVTEQITLVLEAQLEMDT
jgi:hypothetical protein